MFRSLYSKLAAVLLGLFFLVGIVFILSVVYSTEMYQKEVNQRLNHDVAAFMVADKIILKDNKINQEAMKELFHMLMVINPSLEVYLLDSGGNILAFSAEPGRVKRTSVDIEPIESFLNGNTALPIVGDDPRDPSRRKVFTVARIPDNDKPGGYLYIILGGEIYDSVIKMLQGSYIFRLTTWTIVTCLAVAVIAGLIIFSLLTRRLKRLAVAMERYKSGDALARLNLPVTGVKKASDEIDRLLVTFQQMACQIEEQVESLKRVDGQRRELVANVSHDLRTPLATLQGYMETLLMKDGLLSREDRLQYLHVAIRHCKRLGKLVSDLSELAKLEALETNTHCESFNISELVQDVVQKFQLVAKEKNINIFTNVGENLPFVSADIALIERVIENLLDNALRHTPDKGSIGIVLKADHRKVTIQVSDTGRGIPEEKIQRIFDRFYQLDESSQEKSVHSGLGLAITKRILELHKQSIKVTSELNVGTTFTFSLPVYQQ